MDSSGKGTSPCADDSATGSPRDSPSRLSTVSEDQTEQAERDLGVGRSQPGQGTLKRHSTKVSLYGEYSRIFAVDELPNISREQVNKASVVIIGIKTSKKVEEAPRIIARLVAELECVFDHSIMMYIDDKADIRFGSTDNSNQHAYLVTVTALKSVLTPLCNNRYTGNIQREIHAQLRIPPDRGMVKFEPMPEANLGTKKKTYLEEISILERETDEERKARNVSRTTSVSRRASLIGSNSIFRRDTFKSKSRARNQGSLEKGDPSQAVDGMELDIEPKSKLSSDDSGTGGNMIKRGFKKLLIK
ncbi:uncharacterized protein GIQ15_03852 [Arthroderma uncinatum]|uniref:uncharacterized protein n=1 Tax=Arthroderma uncinatum TaxID=74035 RepID=UPI00144A6932|nr:uncharacterized protein GIQ15_03852 [Arthroderma uncinatum]KAF3481093.1 hypothetical protein GIQ15_03852 [Arthroderma uncinatum]